MTIAYEDIDKTLWEIAVTLWGNDNMFDGTCYRCGIEATIAMKRDENGRHYFDLEDDGYLRVRSIVDKIKAPEGCRFVVLTNAKRTECCWVAIVPAYTEYIDELPANGLLPLARRRIDLWSFDCIPIELSADRGIAKVVPFGNTVHQPENNTEVNNGTQE